MCVCVGLTDMELLAIWFIIMGLVYSCNLVINMSFVAEVNS